MFSGYLTSSEFIIKYYIVNKMYNWIENVCLVENKLNRMINVIAKLL